MAVRNRNLSYEKPKNALRTLFRLLTYFKSAKLLFFIAVVSIVLYSLAIIGAMYLMKPLVNYLEESSILTPDERYAKIQALLIGMAILYFSAVITNYLLNRIMLEVSSKVLCNLRIEMFEKMEKLPISYFDKHTHGELMSYYTNDVDAIRDMLHGSITQMMISALSLVGIIGVMIVLSIRLFVVMIVMSVVITVIIKFIAKRSKKCFAAQQQNVASLNGYIEEMMLGQREVKVFNHEELSVKEFDRLNEELTKAATSAGTFSNIIGPIINNLSHFFYALTTALGVLIGIEGGILIAFINYIRQFSNRLSQISEQFSYIMRCLAGADRVFSVIDATPEDDEGTVTLCFVEEKDGILCECDKNTGMWAWKKDGKLIPLKGDVRFQSVDFSYDGKKRVLNNVSLFAKPGQKLAFVGSTGSGKTTTTNLINRFYDVKDGEITYDGINIKDIKKDDLRRSLGIVLQDTHLFTGSVADNIRYGRPDASDEEVVNAAKLANADYFISHLPEGYNTVLTDDGSNLSQGQRQLLAIARAAVASPPVLILDEATSSVDTRTEKLIEQGMDKLMQNKTVFVIAHRLSTVRNSNAIIVLENGEIIERGSHDDLLRLKGKYYKLYTGMFELQ